RSPLLLPDHIVEPLPAQEECFVEQDLAEGPRLLRQCSTFVEMALEERGRTPVQRRQPAVNGVAADLCGPLLPLDLAIHCGHVAHFEVAPRLPHVPLGGEPLVSSLTGEPDQLVGPREPLLEVVGAPDRPPRRAEDVRQRTRIPDPAGHLDRSPRERTLPRGVPSEGPQARQPAHHLRPQGAVAVPEPGKGPFEEGYAEVLPDETHVRTRQNERGACEKIRVAEA